MKLLRRLVRWALPIIARLHWKNWPRYTDVVGEQCDYGGLPETLHASKKAWDMARWQYPQLWYCWPEWTRRHAHPKIYAIRTWLCGLLSGHEVSDTEWGYGGGGVVDRHCRWCDKVIQFPLREDPPPPELQDYVDEIDEGSE